MFLIAVFTLAVTAIFITHVIVMRKAINEHHRLMATAASWALSEEQGGKSR